MTLTHFDAQGQARMVDVTQKQPTVRSATAVATVLWRKNLQVGAVP